MSLIYMDFINFCFISLIYGEFSYGLKGTKEKIQIQQDNKKNLYPESNIAYYK